MGLKESYNRNGAIHRLSELKTNPELENLAKYLLVARAQVGLREMDARVEPIDTQTKIRPVVITSNPTPDLTGFRSGQRSALLTVDGDAFKIEGCRVEKAFGKGKFYTTENRAAPVGGYLLSVAQKRIEAIQGINKRLKEEEWPVPYEPEAIIHYGKEFRLSLYGIWGPLVKLAGGKQYAVQEELASPVMRIKGDTRLSEFYPLKPEHGKAAQEIAFSIGLMAGAQDRKRSVRTNVITKPKQFGRYLQNFVVFLEGDQVYVAKVGDENAFLYRLVKNHVSKFMGVGELVSDVLRITSEDEEDQEEDEEEEGHSEEAEDLVKDALKRSKKPYHHRPFREQFWLGYEQGHKNPDSRKPVTITYLRETYGLKT